MLDKIGNELAIGDYVTFVQGSCGYKQSPNIVIGQITSYVGEKMIQVTTSCGSYFNKMPASCIKIYHK